MNNLVIVSVVRFGWRPLCFPFIIGGETGAGVVVVVAGRAAVDV